MNPDLQKQLAEMLAKVMDVTQDAAKWAGSQIPPLVQEKIAFGRAWESAALVLIVVGAAVSVKVMRWGFTRERAESPDHPGYIFVMLFGAFGACALSAGSIAQLQMVLMVWLAPRLYIVEWLRGMVTK